MEIDVYTQKGDKKGKIELPQGVFDERININFFQQVIDSQRSNRRRVIARTKDRGEVRGGGKKPWRQKGTGRARVGSSRSPIWKGGGVTFGPTGRENFKKGIPKKFKKKALLMALTRKLHNKRLVVLDDLEISEAKTKYVFNIFKNLSLNDKSCLVALPKKDSNIVRAVSNLPRKKVEEIRNLNALDVISHQYFITTKSGIKFLKDKFGK